MKVYIAGPMRSKPQFNFPEFDRVTALLRSHGVRVINPADVDRVYEMHPENDYQFGESEHDGKIVRECVRRDVEALCTVDAVVMLEDWQQSTGATAEKHVGHWLGIPVFELADFLSMLNEEKVNA